MRDEGESPKSFDEIRSLPDAEWKAYLKTLSIEEMFKLALEGIQVVEKGIEEVCDNLEASFERHLEENEEVKKIAEELLARVMKK